MSSLVLDGRKIRKVRERARPALAECLCGCGTLTKGRFAPGHDTTLKQSLWATVEKGSPAAAHQAKLALKAFGWD